MNCTETVRLCAIIRALCPSQKFDDMTPDAWSIVLDDIPFADAETAVRTIYREQGSDAEWIRRIEADDIIREVKRVRARRLESCPNLLPPPGLSVEAEVAWLRGARRAVADGQPVPDTRGELVGRPVALAIEAAAKAPAVTRRKRDVAGHAITQAEIDRAMEQINARDAQEAGPKR
jgi:hypothetical protein